MTLKWKNAKGTERNITSLVEKITWSGAGSQAARQLSFSIANDPYDKNVPKTNIKNGELVKFYDENTLLFYGHVANIQRRGEIGTVEYIAYDALYHLLQSQASYRFTNKTPEFVAKAVCHDYGIPVGSLRKTKVKLKKYIPTDKSPYQIIKSAYAKASKKTGTTYRLEMDGSKFTVIPNGKEVNVKITASNAITSSDYQVDTSKIIDQVVIYTDKNKKVGIAKDNKLIKKYGTYQGSVRLDKKKSTTEARNMLTGPEKSASITSLGDIKAVSGRKIQIVDAAANITGTYYIKNDSHEFSNGNHMMTLDLYLKAYQITPEVKKYKGWNAAIKALEKKEKAAKTTTKKVRTKSGKAKEVSYKEVERYQKAYFTAYYPSNDGVEGGYLDSLNHQLNPSKQTCAISRRIPLKKRIRIKDFNKQYNGKVYYCNDRLAKSHDTWHGHIHVDILVAGKSVERTFPTGWGKIAVVKKVRVKNSSAAGSASNKKIQKMIEIAESFLGKVTYSQTGPRNPAKGSADCSSFVAYCLKKATGIYPGGDTGAQIDNGRGKKITKISDLQAGDLCYFRTSGSVKPHGVGHVTMMISKKKMIHCTSGKGVCHDTIDRPYRRSRFIWARRYFKDE